MPIKACNNFVFVIRDEIQQEKGGLLLPSSGKIKPHTGKIFSIGHLVKDLKIKNGVGKTALFHKGVGQTIDFEGVDYLVLEDHQIIGIK